MLSRTLLASLALAGAGTALAQDRGIEYRDVELEETDSKLETSVTWESEWYEYDNLDLRPLDESSDQAILDSDDRNGFAFTGLSLDLGYDVDEDTKLVVSASHRGLWGNDQMGSVNRFGGWLWFSAAYVDWRPLADNALSIKVGRQYYQLGGLGGTKDYLIADVLDGVRADVKLGGFGKLVLWPVNLYGLSGENDSANFFGYISQGTTQTFGFRGDHMTRRHGLTLVANRMVEGLDVRAYAWYTDIGALGTGSDITYEGKLGNFADNDWVANMGIRGEYALGAITPFAAFDYSMGIDRKELVTEDVETTGYAITAGVAVDTMDEAGDAGFEGDLGFYQALGATYDDEGRQISHGYVGMKGRQAGGMMVDRFMGWHPAAYVGMFGVSHSPHDVDRKAGTRVISARGGYELPGPMGIHAGYWFFQDTGFSYIEDYQALEGFDPPFGYSTREFAAEQRLGRTLGQEIDLTLTAQASEAMMFFINGAAFLPGEFYSIEIDRVAGDQLGGASMAWTGNGGMEVQF